MKRVLAVLVLVTSALGAAAPPDSAPDLTVHEWGTFLAVQGSNGVTLEGMYHEEHALPGFVHSRSRDGLRLPSMRLKGETPVIYFYTPRPLKLEVEVGFPSGLWTQWYPQAVMLAPGLAETGTPPRARNGKIAWSVQVTPPAGGRAPVLPDAGKGSLWNHAREVEAAYVQSVDRARREKPREDERFIFYRGLGEADLPLTFLPEGAGTLRADGDLTADLRHLFVLRVEGGRAAYRSFPGLPPGGTLRGVLPSPGEGEPLEAAAERLAADLAGRLVESGLYPLEARALVNTWRSSYFGIEGTRVLFVLPQEWTDRFIPLKVWPRPGRTVRVMVGRLEVLSAERERRAEEAVLGLASLEGEERERAFASLLREGRYLEPVLRRVLATTTSPEVQKLCRRLLLTGFVTELQSALDPEAPAGTHRHDPAAVRAHLSSLLRELGLEAQARAEAEAALREYQGRKLPSFEDDQARHHLRAFARAAEGLGDDRAAAEAYGELIRFAAQFFERKECAGCHDSSRGPRHASWYPGFWAGERYARHLARLGSLEEEARRLEVEARDGVRGTSSSGARAPAAVLLKLAYLEEARGRSQAARELWQRLGAVPGGPLTATAGR